MEAKTRRPCARCRLRPRKPGNGYCRECYNAYNRERYRKKKAEAGEVVYGMEERDREAAWGDTEPLSHEAVAIEQQALITEGYKLDWFEKENWTPRQQAAYNAMVAYESERLEGLKD